MANKLFSLLKLSFARDIIYRANFWSAIFSRLGFLIVSILWFSIMYSSLLHVKNWGYPETMFFLATFQLIETSTVAIFGNSFATWHRHINSGSLDLILTKPINTQLILSLQAISFPQLLTIGAPISLLIGLSATYHIFPSWLALSGYTVAIILAIATFYGVWLLLMNALFWFVGISHWHHLFEGLTEFLQVPPIVYEGIIKFLFYFVLPIFTAVMIPLNIVWQNSLQELGILALIAVGLNLIAHTIFRLGLKAYNSASS